MYSFFQAKIMFVLLNREFDDAIKLLEISW